MFLTEKCVYRREQLEERIMEYHALRRIMETEDLQLYNSTFQCEALGRCTIQCSRPSDAILRKSKCVTPLPCSRAFETGCTTEWFIHGNVASGLVAICIWVLLNLFRLLLVDAYKNDRRASSGNMDIAYSLRCCITHSLVLPANSRGEVITTGSQSVQETFARKLKKKQSQLKRRATVEKWLALFLQVVWVGALIVVAPMLSTIQRIGEFAVC